MKQIIQINHLNKSFGTVHAVRDLSFSVTEGTLFAFLGVNGAGKSTTIRMLCGQLPKDSGSIVIDSQDLDTDSNEIKRKIGVVFQDSVLDSALSVLDNLESRAALYGIVGDAFQARLAELSELFSFSNLLQRTTGKLSGGQRRRIDIARALLHRPKLLILDEPTAGLDPQTRKTLWDIVSKLRKEEGMTVFLTTHYMEEAAEAENVVILDGGQIVAQGTPLELKNAYTGDSVTLYGAEEESVKKLGVRYEAIPGAYRLSLPNTQAATDLILRYPEIFSDYEIVKGNMDDVFLAVTGKKLSGGTEK